MVFIFNLSVSIITTESFKMLIVPPPPPAKKKKKFKKWKGSDLGNPSIFKSLD